MILSTREMLLKAQKEMQNAKKGANNPFFKSKYADLNSVREACMPLLNENGILVRNISEKFVFYMG